MNQVKQLKNFQEPEQLEQDKNRRSNQIVSLDALASTVFQYTELEPNVFQYTELKSNVFEYTITTTSIPFSPTSTKTFFPTPTKDLYQDLSQTATQTTGTATAKTSEKKLEKKKNPLMETLEAYQKRDPAARSKLEVLLLYQGVHATIYHWWAHRCYKKKYLFLARAISQWSRFWTGIEIHPGATIGRRFVIDHGMGIVIGETAEIGDDVLLYHGVTLGGTGKDQGKRHPTIGNNVLIGCGAKILGPFKVGDGSRIAANSVVLQEVPDCATAVGIPAQIVKVAGKHVSFAEEVDQVNVGDPRSEAIAEIRARLDALEGRKEKKKKRRKEI